MAIRLSSSRFNGGIRLPTELGGDVRTAPSDARPRVREPDTKEIRDKETNAIATLS